VSLVGDPVLWSALAGVTPVIILALLASGLIAHFAYINGIYRKVSSLSEDGHVPKDKLFKELSMPQGPNFDALAKSSWMLLFVAVAYYLFLTPIFFRDLNYFRISDLASSSLGFFFFGAIPMALGWLISGPIHKAYSIYEIPMEAKRGVVLTYVLLTTSVVSSAYIGTIYPYVDSDLSRVAGFVAFVTLALSLILLFLPIYRGAFKVIR
jgi:hypothetical protein